MKKIVSALYREPVLFSGVVVATTAGLAAGHVIAVWIPAAVAAVAAVITRRFTTPAVPNA